MFPSDEKQLTFVARIQQLAFQTSDVLEPEVTINRHPEPYRRGLDRCKWSDVIEVGRRTIDFPGWVRCVNVVRVSELGYQYIWESQRSIQTLASQLPQSSQRLFAVPNEHDRFNLKVDLGSRCLR